MVFKVLVLGLFMATRLYLPSDIIAPPFTPLGGTGWDDESINQYTTFSTSKRSSAMTTVSFADADATSRDIRFYSYVSPELTVGQTVTGSQAVKLQMRGSQVALTNNMFLVFVLHVQNISGPTINKTLFNISAGRDNTELATSLTNRQFTGTSGATNYTTVAGDYIVLNIGTRGDPDAGSDHDSSIRLGDAAASDLPEDDTDTTDLNPWIELADTLTFVAASAPWPGWIGAGGWF